MVKRFFIILGLLTLIALVCNRYLSDPISFREDKLLITEGMVLLFWISFLLARSWHYLRHSGVRKNIKYALIWMGIFLVAAVAHSYRFELASVKDKVLANLLPGRSFEKAPGKMSFHISSNGHFYISAMVNNVPVRFLADTGASDIVFSPKDGRRLGFRPEELNFNRIYQTANGQGRGASIRLDRLQVGALRLRNIRASVNQASMRNSLLGMRFFNRLKGYDVKNGILTLYYEQD